MMFTLSMFGSFLKGLLIGLPFVFMLGPALFSILQTSIHKGFYSGMQLAIGIALSDMLIMGLCYFGLINYIQEDVFQIGLGFGGTIIMTLYGLYIFNKGAMPQQLKKPDIKIKVDWLGVFSEIGKGFTLNILNPFLWILWLSIISTSVQNSSRGEALCFMLGIVTMIFVTDVLKSFFANKIKRFLSQKTTAIINKVAGILLMACAAFLLIKTLVEFDIFKF